MLSHARPARTRSVGGTIVVGTLIAVLCSAGAFAAKAALEKTPEPAVAPGVPALDASIQLIADKALETAIRKHRARAGFAVVSDPATGRLLAVANRNEREWKGQTGPWALGLRVEAASVFKALVTAFAVEKGATTLEEKYDCGNGDYEFGGEKFQDWKAFGTLTAAETVLQSSNICGLKVAQRLGAEKLGEMLRDFGFGDGGVTTAFPGARPGQPPSLASMPEARFIASVGTGVGVSVSPLEIVQSFGAIANGGQLMKPIGADAAPETATVLRRVLSVETARKLRGVLADVMVKGTARLSQGKHYRLAGKTGSASSPWFWDHDRLGGNASVASFAGFAPADEPRVVVYVAIEDPGDDQPHGATHAAPVFREIAENVLTKWGVAATR